ncbi:MAG: outer membrane beta-barrel protein [Pseudomonadota bacterium]
MKLIAMMTLVGCAGLVGLAPPARSDDLAARFDGAYVGLNVGAAFGNSRFTTAPNCVPDAADGVFCVLPPDPSAANGTTVAASGTGRLQSTGFSGGVQAGYNWQAGTLVYGAEADVGAFSLRKSVTSSGTFPSAFLGTQYSVTESMNADWLATFRGRIGVTIRPDILLYATGGLALTRFSFNSSYRDNAIDATFPGGTGSGGTSGLRTGWIAGGGAQWAVNRTWSVRAEYLYVDFGSVSVAVPLSNTPAFTQVMQVGADLRAHIARIGLDYRF